MALLNGETVKFIRTYEDNTGVMSDMPGTWLCSYRTWDDGDYFLIEFFSGNAFVVFPIETLIPEDILQQIKTDDKTFLYLCNAHEAFLDIVEPLYESLVLDAGIPPKKIYLGNGTPDLEKEVRKYADSNNLEYMNVEWILIFEEGTGQQAKEFKLDGSTILTDKIYDKRYLNFNRRWRIHRPMLVALLKAKNLLDKGFVSLAPCENCTSLADIWGSMIYFLKRYDNELYNILNNNKDEIINLPPLYLDKDDLNTNHAQLDCDSLYLYENSIVSVVSETTFFTEKIRCGRFFSEKIFKPIAVGHPFIFITLPKSLEKLKELGYKTFHPFIDESYDNEFNNYERIKKIIKEIERICNFTDEEVKEFCKNVKSICDYNQQHLLNRVTEFNNRAKLLYPNFTHETFIKKTL